MDTNGSQSETVRRLAAAIEAAHKRIDELEQRSGEPIAIIGMGCRIPGGADDPDGLWSLLSGGVDAVTALPPERVELLRDLGDTGFDDPAIGTVHGAFLDGIDGFEPAFFGISEREAKRMDPQHRLLLEVAWQALENAAIKPADLRGSRTGLYVGVRFEDFAHRGLFRPDDEQDVALSVGSSRSLGVGRVAYTLDLHGPVLQLDTTCSSSLLAVDLAAHALRRGDCDVAIAGGVNALLAHEVFLAFQRMGALSRSGRCRSFDADGDGYVRGEGCGLVVLKPLAAAVADDDHIWAVIKGTAVNHDGRSNGLTAPNASAQETVIRSAIENAGISPLDVQYLEAHGTGTPLGDPIELGAAMRVLGEARPADRPLYVGSIKSNVGHLEGAAGVAGLMKAALAIHHRRIPPNQHFTRPNERIAWDTMPVRVPTAPIDWPTLAPGALPHAGVSSFGMSGTNVHVVVGPAPPRAAAPSSAHTDHTLMISARTETSLRGMAARFADALERPGGPSINDMCFTANTTRQTFDRRATFRGADAKILGGALREFATGGMPEGCRLDEPETTDHDAGERGRRVPLPPYVFDRKRLWLDAVALPEKTVEPKGAPEKTAPGRSTPTGTRALLLQAIADAMDRPIEQIDEQTPLSELGIDSLATADVLLTMERELGRALDDGLMTQTSTIVSLAELIDALPDASERSVEQERV